MHVAYVGPMQARAAVNAPFGCDGADHKTLASSLDVSLGRIWTGV